MKTITVNPNLVAQLNPAIVGEMARKAALEDAEKARLGLFGVLGLAAFGTAAWLLYRAR